MLSHRVFLDYRNRISFKMVIRVPAAFSINLAPIIFSGSSCQLIALDSVRVEVTERFPQLQVLADLKGLDLYVVVFSGEEVKPAELVLLFRIIYPERM